jgi:phosphoesterase RecJ-like protein
VVINIDHHTRNDLWKMVDINYISEESSSTSEIVYKLLVGLGWTVSPTMATALLAGVYTDTGGFKHPNTSGMVLDVVADLLRCGGKLRKIAENIENSRSVDLFRLWGIALNRLKYNAKYGISVSVLTQKDLLETAAAEDDIAGLINLLNSTPESKAALLLYETADARIKGSLRTESDQIDVSALARNFGGGGHRRASGFSFRGRIEITGDSWRII